MGLPQPTVTEQSIQGFFLVDLVSNILGDDARGTFREAWQAEKMQGLGLPEFNPVQSNVAESGHGVLRGIHAEPWEKYVHLADGTAFGAWVDLRPDSPSFRTVLTLELTTDNAVFVPRGVGNSYLVTSDRVIYTYLVNQHWRPDLEYPAVAYDDPALGIDWPIPADELVISDKDRANPTLHQTFPESS